MGDYQDQTLPNTPADASPAAIARHLIEFLEHEVSHGRLPANLLPLQSGIGNIANAVIGGLAESKFENLKVWTEVLQDTFLDLFDSGKLSSQRQLPSASRQMASKDSTITGTNITTSSFCDPSKSRTRRRSFDV